MQVTKHHPAPELLLSYSAGSASSGQAICIAAHLDYCAACRLAHHRNNAIGGMLLAAGLETAERHAVSNGRKQQVLEAITSRKASSDSGAKVHAADLATREVPRPLRRILPMGFAGVRWNLTTWSVRNAVLSKEHDGAVISLLKIRAGGKVSHHRHMGDEYTVILQGSFSDEDGLYGPGDFLLRRPGEKHSPVATRDRDCICLTVQEAPLQFSGGIWRLLNPLLRKNFNA